MKKEKGVVYIAKGEKYIKESICSARSLKSHSDIDITLFCDKDLESEWVDRTESINNNGYGFDGAISDDLAPYLCPNKLPYEKTLFLDSDTFICEDISGIFSILDNFDIGLSHNPGSRIERKEHKSITNSIPNAFPRYNGGVILFKNNIRVEEFFNSWKTLYEDNYQITSSNQPTLRKAMYESSVRISTLPSEYNLRIKYNGSVGFMSDSVKIIHGRHPAGLSRVENELNKYDSMRVYTMKKWPIEMKTDVPGIRYLIPTILSEGQESHTFRGRVIKSIQERGFQKTIKKIVRELTM